MKMDIDSLLNWAEKYFGWLLITLAICLFIFIGGIIYLLAEYSASSGCPPPVHSGVNAISCKTLNQDTRRTL